MANYSNNHLLMLVHRIPYPPDKGDKIRSYNLLKHFSQNGWRIHLCAFYDQKGDEKYIQKVNTFCETSAFFKISTLKKVLALAKAFFFNNSISVTTFYLKKAQEYVNQITLTHPVRILFCYCSPMAEYFFKMPADCLNANSSLIMDLVDVDSEKWEQYAKTNKSWKSFIFKREANKLLNYEKKIIYSFNAITLTSNSEVRLLREKTGYGENIHVLSNGVDTDFFTPNLKKAISKEEKTYRMVFCGLMNYFPNVDAVIWFVKKVMPQIKKKINSIDFLIVGGKPVKVIRDLTSWPEVHVIGRVHDVRSYVLGADISVAPIRIARGIQNKVLEAMAMGMPVVATKQAFEGIEAIAGEDLLVTEAEPEPFAEAIVSLFRDQARARRLGIRARRTVQENYTWKERLSKLDEIMKVPKMISRN